MAANPTAINTQPQQAQDILVSKIRVGPRLRELDQTWALALSGIMNDEGGQRTPVDVYPVPGTDEFVLGPGLHRLAARKIGGHETVRAFVLADASDLERRSREVSENLWRKGLDPLERAAFVAELLELRRLKAGLAPDVSMRSVAVKARWEKALKAEVDDASDNLALAYGFTEEVAEAVGVSRRSIYRDIHLHKALQADVANLLTQNNSDLRRNASQLQALAKLDPAMQRKVAGEIIEGRAKNVSDAVKRLTPGTAVLSDPQDIAYVRAVAAWSRLSAKNKALLFNEVIRRDPAVPAALKSAFSSLPEDNRDETEVGPVLGQADRGLVGSRPAGRGAISGGSSPSQGRRADAGRASADRAVSNGAGGEAALAAQDAELAATAHEDIGEAADV